MVNSKQHKYWLVYTTALALALSLVFTFWFVFHSLYLANFPSITKVRGLYQNTVWRIKDVFLEKESVLVPFKPIYTFQVQKWQDRYVYSLIGKFKGVDEENGIIYLLGHDNKVYKFKISSNFSNLVPQYNFSTTYTPVKDIVRLDNPRDFTDNTSIMLYWDDYRTLREIYKDYSQDKENPLNNESDSVFYLIKSG